MLDLLFLKKVFRWYFFKPYYTKPFWGQSHLICVPNVGTCIEAYGPIKKKQNKKTTRKKPKASKQTKNRKKPQPTKQNPTNKKRKKTKQTQISYTF